MAKNVRGAKGVISILESAKVKVLVIPTDEELVIARDVERFKINKSKAQFDWAFIC